MKNTKPQIPGFIRFLLGILSFALCLCLLVSTLVTILVADVNLLTSKVGLQQLIKDLLFTTSAPAARPGYAPAGMTLGGGSVRFDESDLPAGDFSTTGSFDMDGFDLGNIDLESILSGQGNLSDALADAVFEAVASSSPEEIPFTREDVQEFIEESTIPEFLSDKVAGLVSDTLLGEESTSITVEEVMTVIEENKELIEETFQVEIPEEDLAEVETMLNETFTDGDIAATIRTEINKGMGLEDAVVPAPGAPESPVVKPEGDSNAGNTVGSVNKGPLASIPDKDFQSGLALIGGLASGQTTEIGMSQILTLLRFVASAPVLIGMIIACLLLIGLLFLTNWGRPGSAMVWAGVPVFIAGGLASLPAALGDLLATLLPINLAPITNLLSYISIGVTVLGLALVIVGIVVGGSMEKARRKAAAASEPCCEHITINPTAAVEPVCEITEDPVPETAEEIEEAEECAEEAAEAKAEEETEETAEV